MGPADARLSTCHLVRPNGQWVHGSVLDAAAERRGVPVLWLDIAPTPFDAATTCSSSRSRTSVIDTIVFGRDLVLATGDGLKLVALRQ